MSKFEVNSDLKSVEADVERVRQGLADFNASIVGKLRFSSLVVFARDDAGIAESEASRRGCHSAFLMSRWKARNPAYDLVAQPFVQSGTSWSSPSRG